MLLSSRSVLSVTAALALATAGCSSTPKSPSGAEGAAASTAPASPALASPLVSSSSPAAAPTPTPRPAADGDVDKSFTIAFAEGKPSGDTGRLRVSVGERIRIRVTSLRADEIHLHGYDLSAPVDASKPGVLTFTATIPGVFELELEDLGAQLATLQVQ